MNHTQIRKINYKLLRQIAMSTDHILSNYVEKYLKPPNACRNAQKV